MQGNGAQGHFSCRYGVCTLPAGLVVVHGCAATHHPPAVVPLPHPSFRREMPSCGGSWVKVWSQICLLPPPSYRGASFLYRDWEWSHAICPDIRPDIFPAWRVGLLPGNPPLGGMRVMHVHTPYSILCACVCTTVLLSGPSDAVTS